MKTMFTRPEIEVLKFEIADVITTSGDYDTMLEDEF